MGVLERNQGLILEGDIIFYAINNDYCKKMLYLCKIVLIDIYYKKYCYGFQTQYYRGRAGGFQGGEICDCGGR